MSLQRGSPDDTFNATSAHQDKLQSTSDRDAGVLLTMKPSEIDITVRSRVAIPCSSPVDAKVPNTEQGSRLALDLNSTPSPPHSKACAPAPSETPLRARCTGAARELLHLDKEAVQLTPRRERRPATSPGQSPSPSASPSASTNSGLGMNLERVLSPSAAQAAATLRPAHRKLVRELVAQGWSVSAVARQHLQRPLGTGVEGNARTLSHAELVFTSPLDSEFKGAKFESFRSVHAAILRPRSYDAAAGAQLAGTGTGRVVGCASPRAKRTCTSAEATRPESSSQQFGPFSAKAMAVLDRKKAVFSLPASLLSEAVRARAPIAQHKRTLSAKMSQPLPPPPLEDPSQSGFVILSRWGRVMHKAGCACLPCASQRSLLQKQSPKLDETPIGAKRKHAAQVSHASSKKSRGQAGVSVSVSASTTASNRSAASPPASKRGRPVRTAAAAAVKGMAAAAELERGSSGSPETPREGRSAGGVTAPSCGDDSQEEDEDGAANQRDDNRHPHRPQQHSAAGKDSRTRHGAGASTSGGVARAGGAARSLALWHLGGARGGVQGPRRARRVAHRHPHA
eukprot:CAMPEP_0114230856 /NCGR_PEP_ID=MMETSP0058-20121206/3705_1 /TAXON_ID=36894 /ORGANISM="Pyramimonas parkeae, CCMP726" /LENGTH=567 /DNA_ID=CAMNT_0001342109 /DNA_START=198 /DNA_END=1898 /DNA_ORIENTATION=-